MSLYAISPFVCAIIALVLGVFVFLKNLRSPVNRAFALLCFETFWWQTNWFATYFLKTATQLDICAKSAYSLILFLPFTYYHFIAQFLTLGREMVWVRRLYFVCFFWLVLLWSTNFFIAGHNYFDWGHYARAGLLHPIYLVFAILAIGRLLVLVRRSTGDPNRSVIARNQSKFVFLAACLFTVAAIEYLINYGFDFYPIGVYFILASFSVIAYGIIKYRLMDIKLARSYIAIYFSYALISLVIFTPLIIFLRPSRMITTFLLLGGFLVAPYIHRWIEKVLRPAFLSKYSYWDKLAKFWEKERIVFTSGQLADTLKEISEVMNLESFSFFLFEPDRKVFVPRAYQGLDGVFDPEQAEVLNTIYPDDPLVMYLEKEKRIIIRDELVTQTGENQQAALLKMDELRAQISAPLFIAGRLTGILNLGPKKKKEMFHEKDLGLINEVAQTAQRHLSHIAFFENSLFFSGSVAHDIRKPFRQGIIYGYLDALQKGPLNPTQKEALDNLKERLMSLDDMSEDMVGAFKNLELFLKSGFKPQKIDYIQLINEESKSFEAMAEQKRIAFEKVLPKTDLFLYADPLSVQRILNELLTNAIKYTQEGKITVKVSCENPQEVLTEVSDTGCGITKEDQEEIWELFKRGKNGQTKEGAGIGLAMVRQLVEANAGKIWVNSDKGKGTTFYFTLPVAKEKEGEGYG